MPVQLEQRKEGKILEVQVTGKLTREDYARFVPEFEQLVRKHGKLRVVFGMTDFHGWNAGALWEDIKFDLKHFSHIERLAMVGDKKWEEGMSRFCAPFTTAKIRYFDRSAVREAWDWIESP